jgi:hypothetical protein
MFELLVVDQLCDVRRDAAGVREGDVRYLVMFGVGLFVVVLTQYNFVVRLKGICITT